MKVYIVTELNSNVLDVTNRVFSTLEKAQKHYFSLKEEYKDEIAQDENAEEFELNPEHKSVMWDDGDTYNEIILDSLEVEEDENMDK
jgi:hypothetical protein